MAKLHMAHVPLRTVLSMIILVSAMIFVNINVAVVVILLRVLYIIIAALHHHEVYDCPSPGGCKA